MSNIVLKWVFVLCQEKKSFRAWTHLATEKPFFQDVSEMLEMNRRLGIKKHSIIALAILAAQTRRWCEKWKCQCSFFCFSHLKPIQGFSACITSAQLSQRLFWRNTCSPPGICKCSLKYGSNQPPKAWIPISDQWPTLALCFTTVHPKYKSAVFQVVHRWVTTSLVNVFQILS